MEVLCISDLHGDFETLQRICDIAGGFDVLLVAGDLTNFASDKVAGFMLDELRPLVENLFVVPGNCDLHETQDLMAERELTLHGRGRIIGDVGFFGVGGSNITPFNTPLELGEDEIMERLKEGYNEIRETAVKVLVSHSPPKNSVDQTSSGVNAGSEAVSNFINERKVDLVVCGHIHEAKGTVKIGGSEVVNTGPAQDGFVRAKILDDGGVFCEFLSLI